jgi:uncharacterized RmlC-like cupin family protein
LCFFFQKILISFVLILGVEAWTFEQKLGEAVFIPAGCPHQVRNLKVPHYINILVGQNVDVSLPSVNVVVVMYLNSHV